MLQLLLLLELYEHLYLISFFNMRTIQKILRYNFSEEKKKELLEKKIINGCWGKWWINFDKIIHDNIVYVPFFFHDKAESLFKDIRELCFEHDYDFYLWGSIFTFLKANFIFAKWVFVLTSWTRIKYRITLFFIVFLLLCRFWAKYFTFK